MNNQNETLADELLGLNKPCPDISKELDMENAFEYVNNTHSPAKIGDLYLISEQAYKYFLSKCTEDELWDLGFLGSSEEHARSVDVPLLRKTFTK